MGIIHKNSSSDIIKFDVSQQILEYTHKLE